MRKSTIKDVADVAGVSLRTVSRVLNASSKVNAVTRRNVEAVIAEMGFSPSARARALASRKSFLIGLIYDDPNALVLDEAQRGMVEVCGARGFEVVIHPCRYGAHDLVSQIGSFVSRSRIDGAIILPPVSERSEIYTVLAEMGVPATFITAVPVAGDAIIAREREAAQLMAQHLVELGHRHIGHVAGPQRFQSARERQAGFQAMIPHHPDFQLSVEEGDYSFASGLVCGERLLSRSDRPTAIFASNDSMAAGVFKAAVRLGLSVPGDVSVAGFDDSSIAEMLTPALTTIRRPMRQIAQAATRRLLARIEQRPGEPASTDPEMVDLALVVRASTSSPTT